MNSLPLPLALVLLAGSTFAGTAAAAATDVQQQQARAYARKAGTLLYTESHWRYQEQGRDRRLVLYRCTDGRVFARKQLVERASAQAPDFDFEDARDGYREGVRSGTRGRVVYFRASAEDALQERVLAVPADAVLDAGFDASVRAHWPRLQAGNDVSQPFLLPSRMAFVPVRLSPGPAIQWNGIDARRMTMRLDRWYGFVAPTMQLTYASADQRLLEFAGIGTIRDAAGQHQDVRIVFPAPPKPASAKALQDALATPLVSRCTG